jgi:hypothetical protein
MTPTEELLDTCDELMKFIEKLRFTTWPSGFGDWLKSIGINPYGIDELLMESERVRRKVKRSKNPVINWQVFIQNASSSDLLQDFADGKIGFAEFRKNCWLSSCRIEIGKLKKLGLSQARIRAKKAVKRIWL